MGYWQEIVSQLEFAFQPIVNLNSGKIYGFEALLREYDKVGFSTIDELFESAYRDRELYTVDLELRKKAIKKFSTLATSKDDNGELLFDGIRLFYNLDVRVLEMYDYKPGNTKELLKEFGLDINSIIFDVSDRKYNYTEQKKFESFTHLRYVMNAYRQQGFKVAVDDFGIGNSGLEMLYYSDPDMLKIDRFLIKNINKDGKKKLFCMEIIKLAHTQGVLVLAEGVETAHEFYACKDAGFDLAYGHFIQKPTTKLKELKPEYQHIKEAVNSDKRKSGSDYKFIENQMEAKIAVLESSVVMDVVSRFQKDESETVFPVVDIHMGPVGVITEKKLRKYIYSPYGMQIIQNQLVAKYCSKCPSVDIHKSLDDIIDVFANQDELEGIIITENFKYRGFMTAKSLINAINEKNIKVARDQNPLTKLPGNSVITEYLNESFENDKIFHMLVYFDLDNFKPFNDKFGFRTGDRAILLFGDTAKDVLKDYEGKHLLGHIGGDDFFIGFDYDEEQGFGEVDAVVKKIIKNYAQNAESFYDKDDRKRGFIVEKDRFGVQREFGLLTVSASAIELKLGSRKITPEEVMNEIAALKKQAKSSPDRLAIKREFD